MILLMVSGFALAQGEAPDENVPEDEQPEDVPDQDRGIGDLPDEASDNAKKVVSTVSDFIGSGVSGLGDALSGILGGDQPDNQTEE